jgi:hypothetical protein
MNILQSPPQEDWNDLLLNFDSRGWKMRYARRFLMIFLAGSVLSAQPLQKHPGNPHIFLFKGKPAVLIGSGEHYGAVINLDFDYRKYLQTLGREGLNTTRLFTGPHKEIEGAFGILHNTLAPRGDRYIAAWARSSQPGYSEGGNKFDLARFNDAYFARLQDFMREAERQGVIVEVNLFSAFYGSIWPPSPLHPANNVNALPEIPYQKVQTLDNGPYGGIQEAYVRKMVRELNRFDNLYFEIQNEPWADNGRLGGIWNEYIQKEMLKDPGQHWRCILEPANEASLAWQKKIAGIIRAEESRLPQRHLISQNCCNFKLALAEVDPNVDILNFHYALPEAVELNRHWGRVVGFNETGFAGSADDPYRRQAWRFMLSGGGLFNHLDYSFSVGFEDGTDAGNNAPGGGSPALRRQFRILKDFLESLDLVHLQPAGSNLALSQGAFSWMLTNHRNQWAAYCEGYQPFSLELALPSGTYQVEWMDVGSGAIVKKETLSVAGKKAKIQSGENYQEVVVKIVKQGGKV